MAVPKFRSPTTRIVRRAVHEQRAATCREHSHSMRQMVRRRHTPNRARQAPVQRYAPIEAIWIPSPPPAQERLHGAQGYIASFLRAENGVAETYFSEAYLPEMGGALEPEVIPDAYPDFARRYTAEGGVEFTYKDHDTSASVRIVKFFLWLAAMGGTGWYCWAASPYPMKLGAAGPITFNVLGLLVMAVAYAVILAKPVETYRTLEIRPDRMILDRAEEFYRDNFDCGWPVFQPESDEELAGLKLVGIYGTRFVEFLSVVRIDPLDRMPEVLAANLNSAFEQLWTEPGSRCTEPCVLKSDAQSGRNDERKNRR